MSRGSDGEAFRLAAGGDWSQLDDYLQDLETVVGEQDGLPPRVALIDWHKVEAYFGRLEESVSRIAGRSVVFPVGGSGQGKSLFLDYLKKLPIRRLGPAGPMSMSDSGEDLSSPNSGGGMESHTAEVDAKVLQGEDIVLADLPGSGDSRERTADNGDRCITTRMCNEFAKLWVIQSVQSDRRKLPVIFAVISGSSLRTGRVDGLRRLDDTLGHSLAAHSSNQGKVKLCIVAPKPGLTEQQVLQLVGEYTRDKPNSPFFGLKAENIFLVRNLIGPDKPDNPGKWDDIPALRTRVIQACTDQCANPIDKRLLKTGFPDDLKHPLVREMLSVQEKLALLYQKYSKLRLTVEQLEKWSDSLDEQNAHRERLHVDCSEKKRQLLSLTGVQASLRARVTEHEESLKVLMAQQPSNGRHVNYIPRDDRIEFEWEDIPVAEGFVFNSQESEEEIAFKSGSSLMRIKAKLLVSLPSCGTPLTYESDLSAAFQSFTGRNDRPAMRLQVKNADGQVTLLTYRINVTRVEQVFFVNLEIPSPLPGMSLSLVIESEELDCQSQATVEQRQQALYLEIVTMRKQLEKERNELVQSEGGARRLEEEIGRVEDMIAALPTGGPDLAIVQNKLLRSQTILQGLFSILKGYTDTIKCSLLMQGIAGVFAWERNLQLELFLRCAQILKIELPPEFRGCFDQADRAAFPRVAADALTGRSTIFGGGSFAAAPPSCSSRGPVPATQRHA